MEQENKRDLFQSQTSTKAGNYDQERMMRSSGDNDMDRMAPDDQQAREQTNDAYFDAETHLDTGSGDATKSKDKLREQDESLKNSK